MSSSFELAWSRVLTLEGETFHTVSGRAFTYSIIGNAVALDQTNRTLVRSQFEKAFNRMPVSGPGRLQDLQGPSYLFAILTDARITDT